MRLTIHSTKSTYVFSTFVPVGGTQTYSLKYYTRFYREKFLLRLRKEKIISFSCLQIVRDDTTLSRKDLGDWKIFLEHVYRRTFLSLPTRLRWLPGCPPHWVSVRLSHYWLTKPYQRLFEPGGFSVFRMTNPWRPYSKKSTRCIGSTGSLGLLSHIFSHSLSGRFWDTRTCHPWCNYTSVVIGKEARLESSKSPNQPFERCGSGSHYYTR